MTIAVQLYPGKVTAVGVILRIVIFRNITGAYPHIRHMQTNASAGQELRPPIGPLQYSASGAPKRHWLVRNAAGLSSRA